MAGFGGAIPPKIPGKKGLLGGPSLAAFDADDDDPSDRPAFIGGGTDLSDLPAPKRASPLSGVEGRTRPMSNSPLEGIDAPVGTGARPDRSPLALDDFTDLPAPKGPSGGITDLPAPKGPSAGFTDLPAPKGPSGGITDLPAPKGPSAGFTDLPAPKGPSGGITDLPAPKGPSAGFTDLPAPVGPTPSGGADLPAPKGFFDDIPAPKSTMFGTGESAPAPGGPSGIADLPAPKGFFDDVPAPKSTAAGGPAPHTPDLPAPKGFFDDIPAPRDPAKPAGGGGGGMDLPAPKGFFDDVPAPKGPSAAPKAQARTGATGVLDLDDLDLEPSRMAPLPGPPSQEPSSPAGMGARNSSTPLDLDAGFGGRSGDSGGAQPFGLDDGPLDLGDMPSAPPPTVPLELPDTGLSGGDQLAGLDLPDPGPSLGTDDGGVVTFSASAPSAKSAPSMPAYDDLADSGPPSSSAFGPPGGAGLELSATGVDDVVARVEPGEAAKPAKAKAKDKGKAKAKAKGDKQPLDPRKKKLVAIAAVAAIVLGGGGLFGFTRWQSAKDRAAQVDLGIRTATKHINRDQWPKARASAEKVIKLDSGNAAALGIAAQASFAAALDMGTGSKALIAKGEDAYGKARGKKHNEVEKARALQMIHEGNAKGAAKVLSGIAKKARGDASVHLYLGWAYAAAGDHEKAIGAYKAALKKSKKRRTALYGLGLSHLELGQTKDARAAFLAVIEQDKDHIGAQVGVAQLVEVDRFNDRENRYLEILQRKDLGKMDPRAVSRAWALAGDEALRAGRVDEAVSRYAKALELDQSNINALVGEGKAALAQGRYDVAYERLKVAVATSPSNVEALVAYAEASLKAGEYDSAVRNIERAKSLAPKSWRVHLVHGAVLEQSEEGPAAAEDSYRTAMELAGADEIEPTVALSKLLVHLGRGSEALSVLQPVEAAAENDAPLAVTLGVAYLGTGDAIRAETWFRKALERRPGDVEAQLQLGLALSKQERYEEALAILTAAYAADESREDVGVRLAMVYEQTGDDLMAEEAYTKLLARPGVSINVRARAGRFFARIGKTDKAVAQGELILAENNRNAAGHFLRGEGLYRAGDFLEAQREFRQAVVISETAQYHEGAGRAAEKLQLYDEAISAYEKAASLSPKYLEPRLGKARIRLERREYSLALLELEVAKKLAPDNAFVHFYYGECYYETGRDKDAAVAYSESVRIDGKQAYVHYRLGMAYYDLDKASLAAAAFGRATELAEGEEAWLPEGYRLLGYASRTAGNRGAAIRAFRQYMDRSNPGDAQRKDVKKLLLRLEAGGK